MYAHSSTVPVSVVIPTYNCSRFLPETIGSVLAQTARPFEIIVIDDGSTDDTRDRMHSYLSHVIYRYQANQGVSAARNHGVRLASGKFVAFLDADDVWHPRKLELQLQAFRQREDLGLLGTGAIDWPDYLFTEIIAEPGNRLSAISWSDLAVKNRLTTSSVMARSRILRAAGEFDTLLQGPEDRDLWLRIARIASVANLDLLLTGYREVPGSVSKQPQKCQAGMLRILSKLDHEDSWKGERWLRRKAYGYLHHACSQIYLENRLYANAIVNLLRSFAWYPLPFGRDEVQTRFERPKRFIVTVLRMFHLISDKPRHRTSTEPRVSASINKKDCSAISAPVSANVS